MRGKADKSMSQTINATPRWFAAYTASHHEKHILRELASRRINAFLPLYQAQRHWKKRTPIMLDLPLFPNYVFVCISRVQRVTVLETPGVFSIVGSPQQPWELPSHEIETLRRGLGDRKVEPHRYPSVGERVRIKTGILQGLEGVIAHENNNLRFVLTLEQIRQSIGIEVAADELEPSLQSANKAAAIQIPCQRGFA